MGWSRSQGLVPETRSAPIGESSAVAPGPVAATEFVRAADQRLFTPGPESGTGATLFGRSSGVPTGAGVVLLNQTPMLAGAMNRRGRYDDVLQQETGVSLSEASAPSPLRSAAAEVSGPSSTAEIGTVAVTPGVAALGLPDVETIATFPVGGDPAVAPLSGAGQDLAPQFYAYMKAKDPGQTFFPLPATPEEFEAAGVMSLTYDNYPQTGGLNLIGELGYGTGFVDPGDELDYIVYTNTTSEQQMLLVQTQMPSEVGDSPMVTIWAQRLEPGQSVQISKPVVVGEATRATVLMPRSGADKAEFVDEQYLFLSENGPGMSFTGPGRMTFSYGSAGAGDDSGGSSEPDDPPASEPETSDPLGWLPIPFRSVIGAADERGAALSDGIRAVAQGVGQLAGAYLPTTVGRAIAVLGIAEDVIAGRLEEAGLRSINFLNNQIQGMYGARIQEFLDSRLPAAVRGSPVVSLAGLAIGAWSYAGERALEADFSRYGDTIAYAWANPQVAAEETAKAIVDVGAQVFVPQVKTVVDGVRSVADGIGQILRVPAPW